MRRVMVACNTLTWVTVDLDTKEVTTARVFNVGENLNLDGSDAVVLHLDPFDEDRFTITEAMAAEARQLVDDAYVTEWELNER